LELQPVAFATWQLHPRTVAVADWLLRAWASLQLLYEAPAAYGDAVFVECSGLLVRAELRWIALQSSPTGTCTQCTLTALHIVTTSRQGAAVILCHTTRLVRFSYLAKHDYHNEIKALSTAVGLPPLLVQLLVDEVAQCMTTCH
jgi:hypothetical protein